MGLAGALGREAYHRGLAINTGSLGNSSLGESMTSLGDASRRFFHQIGMEKNTVDISSPLPKDPSPLPRDSRRASALAASASYPTPVSILGSPLAIHSTPSISRAVSQPPSMKTVYKLKRVAEDLHIEVPSHVIDDIQKEANKTQTGISMRDILDLGAQPAEQQMLASARFLHQEVPVRLAHRIIELSSLPEELATTSHIQRVKTWYAQSFAELRRFPHIKTSEDVGAFTQLLNSSFLDRHAYEVPAIAKGVEEYKHLMFEREGRDGPDSECPWMRTDFNGDIDLQAFLDNFFLARISTRFLAGHHIALFDQETKRKKLDQDLDLTCPSRQVGLIDMECSPMKIVQRAIDEARDVCLTSCGHAPEVHLHGDQQQALPFIPKHLDFMVFELVKNALRATQDKHETDPPPVNVFVCSGSEDIAIKVTDRGAGIPRSELARVFAYLYTTANSPLPKAGSDYKALPTVLAGYGCGLPLSQLHAKYFGGDLQICPMEGYGMDAILHLSRHGSDEELLPE